MLKRIAIGWLLGAAALIAHAPARPAAGASGSEQPAAAASFTEFDRRATSAR